MVMDWLQQLVEVLMDGSARVRLRINVGASIVG